MFVQVMVAVENITFGFCHGISSSTPSLLYIVFKRIRDVVVNHQPYVFFIHPHTKSRGGHHNLDLVGYKSILVGDFVVGIHFAVERKCGQAVSVQFLR